MCIGNRQKGDDAVGPYIADTLNEGSLENFLVLDCGTVPENFTSSVKRYAPDAVVLIDATDMTLSPGEVRVIPKEMIGGMHISTHHMPLSMLISYLETHVDTVMLIGIQPKKTEGSMSEEVRMSAEWLVEIIKNGNISDLKVLGN